MKFRVRFEKQRRRLVVDVDHENGTVKNLKEAICSEASVRDISTIQVSLNGVDVIEENDLNLNSLGLVNGDLVYALSTEPDEIGESSTSDTGTGDNVMLSQLIEMGFDKELAQHALSQVNYASVEAAIEIITNTEEVKNVQTLHKSVDLPCDETCSSTAGPSFVVENTRYVVDNLCNPVFCRDGVSAVLETLYNTAGVTTHHHAVFVLIHALMLESGFSFKYEGEKPEAPDVLPVGWNNKSVVKLSYEHNLSSSIICQLVLTSLGPFVYAHVWSVETQSNAYEVKLLVSHYIRGDVALTAGAKSVYQNLHKVSRLVKNDLVHPLLANIQSYLGLTSPFSLTGSPPEIKLMIFSQLNAASLVSLSATCKDLNVVSNDEKLWQFFCQRDFGIKRNTVDSWKKQYKILYKRHQQLQRDRAEVESSFYPEFPHGTPGFNPFLPRIPRIIGGPHDLFPDFMTGQPRGETLFQVLHPENRSRSNLRLRTGDRATRGTFFA